MPEAKKVRSKTEAAADEFFNGKTATAKQEDWLETDYSGQLAVDVYHTKESIVIKSTIAGVTQDDLDVSIRNDTVTIRGVRRQDEEVPEDQYYYRECYWGGFSRSIVLPVDVKADKVSATLKNGVLTVVLPKAEAEKAQKIQIEEIDIE